MLDDIRRFLEIVRLKSLTKAAQNLNLTQPALSLSLKRLERNTKTSLFYRTGKQLILTRDGEAVYKIGVKITELWDLARNKKARLSSTKILRLGLIDNAAIILARFFSQSMDKDEIKLEIKIDKSVNLYEELYYGLTDLCVCVLDSTNIYSKSLKVVREFNEELIPVASKKKSYQSTSNIPFLLYNKESTTRRYIDEEFFKHTVKPFILAESTSTTFMKELALSGNGVALLPKNIVRSELAQKKLYLLKLPLRFARRICMLKRRDDNTPEIAQLIDKISPYFIKG